MKINFKKPTLTSVLPFILIAVILLAVFVVWKTNPIDFSLYDSTGITYNRAKVVSVNSQTLEESSDTPGRNIGVQNITVKLLEGKNKGKTITFDNRLSYTHSIEVDAGTRVVVKCDEPEGVEPYYSLYQYDRSVGIVAAILIFLLIICLVGKSKGLRAAIALGVSILIVIGALIPAIYNGISPILVTLIVCMAITAVTLILLNGFSEKTFVAVIATMIGLLASAFLYSIISAILSVTGYAMDETEELVLISRRTGLVIGDILFSGILLASLGAVMDTAMSIASSLFEIVDTKPDIKKSDLYKSGMNIGRDMIGTMCQTLVLAFTGSSVATLLVVISYGTSFNRFISSDFLVTEILQSLIGSFAVILTVPITSVLCSRLHKMKPKK